MHWLLLPSAVWRRHPRPRRVLWASLPKRTLIHTSLPLSLVQQVQILPEFVAAEEFMSSGHFGSAISSYERVVEVLQHAYPAGHPMISHLLRRCAALQHAVGKKIPKDAILKAAAQAASLPDKVLTNQLFAIMALVDGDASLARDVALQTVQSCEQMPHDELEVDLFAPSYSILSLAELCCGDLDQAETFSQLALRWAQTPYQRLIAANNHGHLSWYRLAQSSSNSFSFWQYQRQQFQSPLHHMMSDASAAREALAEQLKLRTEVQATLECWQDALHDQPWDQLVVNELPVAVCYAHLLCNLAEAHELLYQDADAQQCLSSAVKSLQTHEQHRSCQQTLGRALGLLARHHMRSAQAVTAEGLFRSALDKLAACDQDIRCEYDRAMTKGFYGQLLSKWDKRESLGALYQLEAEAAISALPAFPATASSAKYYLTSALQFMV